MLHSRCFNGRGLCCIMKSLNTVLAAMVVIPLLAGCASTPVALAPVGPKPTSQQPYNVKYDGAYGYLQVYSDTKEHFIDHDLPYYWHIGYNIYDDSNRKVKYVPNNIGITDETPTLVQIPQGNYRVVAESSAYGRVTVPVVIQADKTTVLNLDRGWRPSATISTNELVRFPDGEAVGWSSVSR